jgi:hypothetical protein
MYKFKSLFASLFLAAALFFVAGCDDSTDPEDVTELAPPTGAYVSLDQASSSYALVGWSASTDESKDDFVGYKIITYEVSSTGAKVAKFDSVNVNKPTHTATVSSLVAGKYYKTYIHSLMDNNDFSVALETNIYGGVVVKANATVDQTHSSASAKSGYGWGTAGDGVQSSYSSANAANIDLVCRKETNGEIYTFYSPASLDNPLTGARTTKFLALSEDDWSKSDFKTDPTAVSATAAVGNVILIKTQDNEYVKVKIKSVAKAGSNDWTTVTFDYKYQNVTGLRAAKQ